MTYIFLYFVTIFIIFFGFAFWNYKQEDKNKTVPSGTAWTISLFWPVILPLGLIVYIGVKLEETFDNISEKGLKDDKNK
jgi:hypothetical protein